MLGCKNVTYISELSSRYFRLDDLCYEHTTIPLFSPALSICSSADRVKTAFSRGKDSGPSVEIPRNRCLYIRWRLYLPLKSYRKKAGQEEEKLH